MPYSTHRGDPKGDARMATKRRVSRGVPPGHEAHWFLFDGTVAGGRAFGSKTGHKRMQPLASPALNDFDLATDLGYEKS